MTEPQPWPRLPLSQIARFRLGGNYRNTSRPTVRPLIKMGNIARVGMDLHKLEYIPDSESVEEIHRLRYGDVLLNTRNTLDLVGKVSVWRKELPRAYYNSNILRLEFADDWSSVFFGYALNVEEALRAIRTLATGTTSVAAIYSRDLSGLRVPVPPVEEQDKIAQVLTAADDSVRALERLVLKKEDIKRGLMQELLTGGTRLRGFSGEWLHTCAGDVGTFRGGSGFPLAFQGSTSGAYPFLKVSDMNDAGNELSMTTARHYISEDVRTKIGAVVFPANTIVFAKVGGAIFLERKRILSARSCIDNNMAGFVPSPELDVRYMHYALSAIRFGSLVATTALPSLNARQLRAIPLYLPKDVKEQRAIAAVLSDADDELAVLGRRLAKARDVRQALMQQLLTGRLRLAARASKELAA